jgi:hypothetical protein
MELLDRYLEAVKGFLPQAQRDDIVKELGDNLRSQMDDREAELGRPLTEAEQGAILKHHGNPVLVAGRYRQDHRTLAFGRQLIGPVLFPLYVRILGLNLGITAAVCAVLVIALGRPVAETIPTALVQLLIQFGIVTLVFAAAERHLTKYPDAWDPRDPLTPQPVAKDTRTVPRLESLFQLVVYAVALYWLWAVWHSPPTLSDPGSAVVTFGPVWGQVFWPTVLVLLAEIVQAGVNLARPDWTRLRAVAGVAAAGAWLAILGYLTLAGDWVVLADPAGEPAADSLRKIELVNRYVFFYGLLVTAIVMAVYFVLEVRRLLRGQHGRVPPRVLPAPGSTALTP